jgi:hypothetical protein
MYYPYGLSRPSQTDCISMPLLGYAEVAECRLLSWRGLLICIAVLALVFSLASRTIHLSIYDSPTAQSDSPKAKIQHPNKDAVQWTAAAASFLLFWLLSTSLEPALGEKPLLARHVDSCLYNRPPPLS